MDFIRHTGKEMPVKPSARVIYRCISSNSELSHVHHAIEAGDVNWTDVTKTGRGSEKLALGRVHEYKVIL